MYANTPLGAHIECSLILGAGRTRAREKRRVQVSERNFFFQKIILSRSRLTSSQEPECDQVPE